MRALDYMRVSGRDLRRQPVRSGLTILALAISAIILVTLSSISLGTRQALQQELVSDISLQTIVVSTNKSVENGFLSGDKVQLSSENNIKLDDAAVDRLKALGQVQSVLPMASIWEFKDFTVEGWPQKFVAKINAIGQTNGLKTQAGSFFDTYDTAHKVVLGYAYAKQLGLEASPEALLGKKITITTQNGYRGEGANIPLANAKRDVQEAFSNSAATLEATIVGVGAPGANENQLFIPMGWGRAVRTPLYWKQEGLQGEDQIAKNGYTSALVRTASTAAVRPVTESINELGFGATSTQKTIERLSQFTTVMWVVLGAVSLISLITACLGIVNTMLMTITEQRYAIGVWRAFGARRRMIAMQFLLQAGTMGFIGGVIGTAIGYAISRFVNQYIEQLLIAQNLPQVQIAAAPPILLIASVSLTVLFAIISGLYPAIKAAREDPSKALTAL